MPLRDPNSVAFAPGWSRSNALGQADINNMMYNNQMLTQRPMYQRPGGAPARAQAARPAMSRQQRLANARRIEAARRGIAPSGGTAYAPQQQNGQFQGGPGQLANTFQEQIDAANAANESRYEDILGGYREREDMARKQAALAGDQQYRDESARVRNDLIGRGLANSSLLGKGLFDAYERKAQNQLNVDLQTSGDRLAFQERRNDVGPDYAQMLQLAQMQGQTQQFQNQDMQNLLNEIGTAVDQRIGAGNQPSYGGQSRAQAAAQMNYALQGGAPFMMQGGGYNVPNLMGLGMQTAAGRYNDLSNRGRYPAMGPYWNPGGRPGQQFAGHAGPQQGQQGNDDRAFLANVRRNMADYNRSVKREKYLQHHRQNALDRQEHFNKNYPWLTGNLPALPNINVAPPSPPSRGVNAPIAGNAPSPPGMPGINQPVSGSAPFPPMYPQSINQPISGFAPYPPSAAYWFNDRVWAEKGPRVNRSNRTPDTIYPSYWPINPPLGAKWGGYQPPRPPVGTPVNPPIGGQPPHPDFPVTNPIQGHPPLPPLNERIQSQIRGGISGYAPQAMVLPGTSGSDAPPSTQTRTGRVTPPSRPWATSGTKPTYTQQPVPRRM